MICIFIPEKTPVDIIEDIKRIYEDRVQVIMMDYLHEISFSYGLVIGIIMEENNVD